MSNKEKAEKIAIDIRRLAEWIESSEEEQGLFPVSFFSQVTDRLQMIYQELQSLEKDQSESITHRFRQERNGEVPERPGEVSYTDEQGTMEQALPVAEKLPVRSLHEQYRRHQLSDLNNAFNLNDRIRFCKNLFAGDERRMNQVLEALNGCATLDDSLRYLRQMENWPSEDHGVAKELIEILKCRFS